MATKLIKDNKIYLKTTEFLPRLSNSFDYYSNSTKILNEHYVVVPLKKTPSYSIESVVIFSTVEAKCIPILKHFNKHHFSTPIAFVKENIEFCGTIAFGYFTRKLFYIDENDMDVSIYFHSQNIPLTPRSITYVANTKNKSYTDYLQIINKDRNATIFNLSNGIELCFSDFDEVA